MIGKFDYRFEVAHRVYFHTNEFLNRQRVYGTIVDRFWDSGAWYYIQVDEPTAYAVNGMPYHNSTLVSEDWLYHASETGEPMLAHNADAILAGDFN